MLDPNTPQAPGNQEAIAEQVAGETAQATEQKQTEDQAAIAAAEDQANTVNEPE